MALLVRLTGAKKCLEVGVYTGYSALAVALALPDDGQIVACDVSEEYTSVARRYWAEAGVAGKIDLQLRPATETLDQLLSEGQSDTFDFAFVDADKSNYLNYYEAALKLLCDVRDDGLGRPIVEHKVRRPALQLAGRRGTQPITGETVVARGELGHSMPTGGAPGPQP